MHCLRFTPSTCEISRVRDLAREPMPGEIRLQWWREVLLGERAGEAAANPVAAAVLDILGRFAFARDPLVDLVEAHRFDVHDEPMASAEEFQSYASRTAGTIFHVAARILGGDVNSAVTAESGSAQTIATVLSRLPQHAARRQLYVPLDVFGTIQPSRKIFLRCARPRNCGPRSPNCAYARVSISLMSARPKFPKPSAGFSAIGAAPALAAGYGAAGLRPIQPPSVAPWRRQWRIWRAAKSFRRIGA